MGRFQAHFGTGVSFAIELSGVGTARAAAAEGFFISIV